MILRSPLRAPLGLAAVALFAWRGQEASSFTIIEAPPSSSHRRRETVPPSLRFPQPQHNDARPAHAATVTKAKTANTQLGCICVHCKYVTECAAYHFVESRHDQPHMTEHPTFTPRDGSPTIHVNVRTMERSLKHHDDKNERGGDSIDVSPMKASSTASSSTPASPSTASSYSAPAVTYEYDVVACEDFVEDRDCWVRNMPEAIRIANPHFVPS